MNDQHLDKLIEIQKELSTNTESTNGINRRLDVLNGKVAMNSGDISKLYKIVIVVGTVAGTLLITNGSELIKFIMAII